MVSTNSFMDLLQNILGFLLVDALQVRHGKASFLVNLAALFYWVSSRIVNLAVLFLDLPGLFDVLWESFILKDGQAWGHLAAFALDCKGEDLFDARMLLDFNLQFCIRWSCLW